MTVGYAADSMDQPPAPPTRSRIETAIGWLCVPVLTALAGASAVWAVVLLPPLVHPTVLPRIAESLLLAGPGLYLITVSAGRAARSRLASALPALTWLVTVVVLGAGRPEGDDPYLLASLQGLLIAPLGMLAGAVGIARAHQRPWPTGRRAAPNGVTPGQADAAARR